MGWDCTKVPPFHLWIFSCRTATLLLVSKSQHFKLETPNGHISTALYTFCKACWVCGNSRALVTNKIQLLQPPPKKKSPSPFPHLLLGAPNDETGDHSEAFPRDVASCPFMASSLRDQPLQKRMHTATFFGDSRWSLGKTSQLLFVWKRWLCFLYYISAQWTCKLPLPTKLGNGPSIFGNQFIGRCFFCHLPHTLPMFWPRIMWSMDSTRHMAGRRKRMTFPTSSKPCNSKTIERHMTSPANSRVIQPSTRKTLDFGSPVLSSNWEWKLHLKQKIIQFGAHKSSKSLLPLLWPWWKAMKSRSCCGYWRLFTLT